MCCSMFKCSLFKISTEIAPILRILEVVTPVLVVIYMSHLNHRTPSGLNGYTKMY